MPISVGFSASHDFNWRIWNERLLYVEKKVQFMILKTWLMGRKHSPVIESFSRVFKLPCSEAVNATTNMELCEAVGHINQPNGRECIRLINQ
jgi:hypothetical protein